MPVRYILENALLEAGWARDASVTVGDDGFITSIGAPCGEEHARAAEPVRGFVIPGMANAHSHAFQRAMAGTSEYRLSARDSFWTWRRMMYGLANRIEPEELRVVATQLFIEMIKAGYTSVAEFHYLHRRSNGTPYAGDNALWDAISHAAETAQIGLTFLPTLYQTSDFGATPLRPDQARFAMGTEEFLRAIESRVRAERRRAAEGGRVLPQRTGAAFHSLRAVPLDELQAGTAGLKAISADLPVHIHVAEQALEVHACKEFTGRRPIELLLDSGVLSRHWCLVHATHATPEELRGIAAAAATVCVSISTEANLGDGFFDTSRFLNAGGRLCIGSDSQSTVSPSEELRWLEYQQRLRKRRRTVLAGKAEAHVGTRLWCDAAFHGAAAIGQPAGKIAVGLRADWVALDAEHPTLAGAASDAAIDHLLFAGADAAVRDVMVAGKWVVRNAQHPAEHRSRIEFRRLMQQLTIPVYTA